MSKPFILPPAGRVISLRPKLPPPPPIDFEDQPFDRVRRALLACGVAHTEMNCLDLTMRILTHVGVWGEVRTTGSRESLKDLKGARKGHRLMIDYRRSQGLPCEELEISLAEIENELKRLTVLGAQTTWDKPGRGKNSLGGTRRRALADISEYLRTHFRALSPKERAKAIQSLCGVLRLFPFDRTPPTETLRELDRKQVNSPQH